MKRRGFFLLILFFLILLSCKTAPPSGEEVAESETAGEQVEPPVTPDSGGTVLPEIPPGEAELETADIPSADTPPEDAGSGTAGDIPPEDTAAEPEFELAETDAAAFPPEEDFAPALPEPDAADLMASPEPAAEVPAETLPREPDRPPDEVSASPAPAIPPPPPILRPAEEAGPPPIRPAEEERPSSGIVREPVPLPVPPAPEPEIKPLTPPPAVPEENIVFSRIVRATVGQLVEIPFRGTGWVYLGELGARRGVSYDSRRLDPEGQSFVFRAEAAGSYALKFYKQDFIRDYILNDYVQVIVGEAPETSAAGWFNPPLDRGRVSAERWPSALEEADALERSRRGSSGNSAPVAGSSVPPADSVPATGSSVPAVGAVPATGSSVPATAQPAETQPAGAGTPPPARPDISDEGIVPVRPPVAAGQAGAAVPEAAPVLLPEHSAGTEDRPAPPDENLPDEYLQKAREEFNVGRVAGALAVLDQFRERFPAGSDEAWWLYGQFYEANSPSRDIRAALDYYRRLIREYPQSRRYNDARRRIAYLERYYINIQ
jgi:TolA-binding protein